MRSINDNIPSQKYRDAGIPRYFWDGFGVSITSRRFCVTFIGWRCPRESPTSWPWLSIGACMAWHRRICATTCNVSQNWIGARCVLQCPTPLSSHQPDVTAGDRAFPVAGSRLWNSLPTDVTSATTLPVLCSRLKHTYYFLFLFLHDLCCLTLIVPVPLQFLLT